MPGRDLIERVRKALRDRYTVIAAVGRGGNACIFSGRDASGADVAIKVLHPELVVSVAADRFLREIRYASQLNHPHIARLIDSGEADYLLWYVMPYVAGDNLRQALRRAPRTWPGAPTCIRSAWCYSSAWRAGRRSLRPAPLPCWTCISTGPPPTCAASGATCRRSSPPRWRARSSSRVPNAGNGRATCATRWPRSPPPGDSWPGRAAPATLTGCDPVVSPSCSSCPPANPRRGASWCSISPCRSPPC